MFQEFISTYGTTILYTVITAIASWLGIVIKNLYKKVCNTKTKQSVAKTVVMAIEQLYRNLNGEEKYELALENMSEMLKEKGIKITKLEMQMLIEAAVGEFNQAFNKDIELANTEKFSTILDDDGNYDEYEEEYWDEEDWGEVEDK
jgi:LL-H family phage holin